MVPLTVSGLRKSYDGQEVVAGVDFDVARGECFGLLGANGAGKTTVLRCCLGLVSADAGQIRLLGEPIPRRARIARMKVGVVPQFDNLDPDFTVSENLLVFGRYFGVNDARMRERIPALLDFAGLLGKEDAQLTALSGGMKRRLTLARALVNDPDLLILDEPTTGLDPQARHMVWDRLKRLLAEGKTILLTTHFMDEAERLCHRLMILDHGRIIAQGGPRELIADHIEPQVVEVYGEGVAQWAHNEAQRYAKRVELSGDTAFCYVDNADSLPLLAHLAPRPELRVLQRPANLEDVFLKLTGRELRD